MSRPSYLLSFFFSCAALILTQATVVRAAAPHDQLLPNTTKGFISSPDLAAAAEKFDLTEFGKLIADPIMKPFLDDFRDQMKGKLNQAGVKVGIKLEDLKGIRSGEISLAMIQPGGVKTQHATVLLVDVTGNVPAANGLLTKITAQQVQKGAQQAAQKVGDIPLTVLNIPRKDNPGTFSQAVYLVHADTLVAADHVGAAQDIAKRLTAKQADSLDSMKSYLEPMDRCTKAAGEIKPNVRWFVDPIGYAETVKASATKKKRGRDMLKVLVSQGFDAIQSIGGHITFKTADHEVLHRSFVYAPPVKGAAAGERFRLAARMLDFPNSNDLDPLPWVPRDLSTHLTFNAKIQEAFNHVGSLVDEAADAPGVWEDILKGLESDPNGPRINIRKELIAHAGQRVTLLSDYRLPIGPKSERMAVAIEVLNEAAVAKAISKIMESDPNAHKRRINDRDVWEIIGEAELVENMGPDLEIEGAGFTSTTTAPNKDKEDGDKEQKPIIPNWAVTVVHKHLLVATHLDFVKDLMQMPTPEQRLVSAADYQLVKNELIKLGAGNDSFRQFSRTDEAWRPTYELIQQGKMPQAETMLGKILNRMLAPEDETELRKQQIDGGKLPEYQAVRRYLGPAGTFVKSEADGWMITGCLLTKTPAKP